MTTHDAINAVFEGGGAIALCFNVRRLLKDKSVKGVSLVPAAWWTAWGFWNVYFYAAVACSASFWAGIAVVTVQSVWVLLAVWFARVAKAPQPGEKGEALRLAHAAAYAELTRKLKQEERERACLHTEARYSDFNGKPVCDNCGAGRFT